MQTLKLLIFEYFQKLVPHIGDLLEQGEQVRTGTSNSLPLVKKIGIKPGPLPRRCLWERRWGGGEVIDLPEFFQLNVFTWSGANSFENVKSLDRRKWHF
jgi:hypothetical protein